MLGLGWTEMLLIAALALIVVGPRDLPIMLRQLGRAFGIMRRMGNEFKSEFNKMAALDEVRDIRKSITDPLRNAQAEIQREFNRTTPAGVQPSGALKPDAGEGESVVNAIKTQAGMNASPADEAMTSALAHSRQKVPDEVPVELAGEPAKTAASKTASARTTSAKSTGAKAKPAAKSASKPRGKSASAKPAAAKPDATAPAAATKSRPAAKRAGKSTTKGASAAKSASATKSAPAADSTPAAATESKSVAKPRAARKPAVKPNGAKTATAKAAVAKPAEAKSAADKPAAHKSAAARPARKRAASKSEKA